MQNLKKFILPANFRGKNIFIVQLWNVVNFFFFKNSPQILYKWRVFLLRAFGAKIGENVKIRSSVTITYPWKITIGDYSWIGDNVTLYSLGEIIIGANVVVSQLSYLCTGSHDYISDGFDIFSKKIVIKDKVWLCTDVYIAPNVTINEGAIVGSRSSVFKDLESNMVYFGNPAKKVKNRI